MCRTEILTRVVGIHGVFGVRMVSVMNKGNWMTAVHCILGCRVPKQLWGWVCSSVCNREPVIAFPCHDCIILID